MKEKLSYPICSEIIAGGSRHLLHTICVFAERGGWNGTAISENKKAMIEKFENDYQELKEKYDE